MPDIRWQWVWINDLHYFSHLSNQTYFACQVQTLLTLCLYCLSITVVFLVSPFYKFCIKWHTQSADSIPTWSKSEESLYHITLKKKREIKDGTRFLQWSFVLCFQYNFWLSIFIPLSEKLWILSTQPVKGHNSSMGTLTSKLFKFNQSSQSISTISMTNWLIGQLINQHNHQNKEKIYCNLI